jgi:hypothetical protein
MKSQIFAVVALTAAFAAHAPAAPLTTARVTKVINDVKVVDAAATSRPATTTDVITADMSVKTGVKSRSELLFEDNTLTRVGPETIFRFTGGTRDMALERGSMLLQVPKGLGGATIHTAAVTASITGTTIMLEHQPNKDVKVLVLEGSLRLSMDGKLGESVILTPGKMVVMPPDAKRLPTPVTVDLANVVKTSPLVTMGRGKSAEPLPSIGLINEAIGEQAKAKDNADLMPVGFLTHGAGSKDTSDPNNAMNTHEQINAPGNSGDHRNDDNEHAHGGNQGDHGHGHGH